MQNYWKSQWSTTNLSLSNRTSASAYFNFVLFLWSLESIALAIISIMQLLTLRACVRSQTIEIARRISSSCLLPLIALIVYWFSIESDADEKCLTSHNRWFARRESNIYYIFISIHRSGRLLTVALSPGRHGRHVLHCVLFITYLSIWLFSIFSPLRSPQPMRVSKLPIKV